MKNLVDRTSRIQHWLVALLSLWLILTSPWIAMRRVVPDSAPFFDRAHIGLGLALTVLALTYLSSNIVGGRWRQCFPWVTGDLSELRRDLSGIAKRRIPAAGGAGLLAVIQGLLLLLLLAAAATGLGWLLADGARVALVWRDWHIVLADCFAWLLAVHVVASALHLVDFLLD